jgi:hypothetical protein
MCDIPSSPVRGQCQCSVWHSVDFLPSTVQVERIANRNAAPAVALAAFSLATTRILRQSQAIIHPDYLTAPRLSAQFRPCTASRTHCTAAFSFASTRRWTCCRSPRRMSSTIAISCYSANCRFFGRVRAVVARKVIAELWAKNRRAEEFVHFSRKSQSQADATASNIGVGVAHGGLDPHAKALTLKRLGGRTVWIGNGAAQDTRPTLEASTVSVSVAGAATLASDAADVVCLQPGLEPLALLPRFVHAHRTALEADYRVVDAANLFGAAVGLFRGFGSLEAGLASNASTALVYACHWRRLRNLIARVEGKRR